VTQYGHSFDTRPSRDASTSYHLQPPTHYPHKLPAPQLSTHRMLEQHGATSQEACKINGFDSHKNPDTMFNTAAIVAKMDLRLLAGGSGEESTASQSVLTHYGKGKGLVLMFVLS